MLVTNDLINAAKMARRMNTNAFDAQVSRLLTAALRDLYVAGVDLPEQAEPLAVEAAITYFLAHFGSPDEYDRLKASYDEQKAQLSTLTGFTTWGDTTEPAPVPETPFDIYIINGEVVQSGADILAAYNAGRDLRLINGNTSMFASAYDMTGDALTAEFRGGAVLYRVTAEPQTITLRTDAAYTGDRTVRQRHEAEITNG